MDGSEPIDPDAPTAEAGPPTEPPSVESLTAERDALAAQVEELSTAKPSKHRMRKIVAVFLVFAFAVTFVSSGVGIWLHRNTLNSDVWNERVVPLGQDPEVQKALAAYTTDELMKLVQPKMQEALTDAFPKAGPVVAVPLSSAVESFVSEKVDAFYASDRFEELWRLAATKAHDAAISTLRGDHPAVVADSDKIQINLIPLINAVLNEILAKAPGLIGSDATLPKVNVDDVPASARTRIGKALGVDLDDDFGTITIYDKGKLSAAQQAVKIFDKVVVLSTILALACFAGALAVSVRRRRTLLQLLGVAAFGCILIRRICFLLLDDIDHLVKKAQNRPAANVVVRTFVDPLTNAGATALWIIGILVLITVLTGPYGWVRRLRAAVVSGFRSASAAVSDRAGDDQTLEWVAKNADGLRIAGYAVGALLLWFVDLSWLTFFLIALVVAAWQLVLARMVSTAALPEAPDAAPEDTPADTPVDA